MKTEFDQVKRDETLAERAIDFARADEVFAGIHFTAADTRHNYGEERQITAGWLDDRLVVVVWTWRGKARRIISMRRANEREIKRFTKYLG